MPDPVPDLVPGPVRTRRLRAGDRALARRTFAVMDAVFEAGATPLGDAYLDRLLARDDFWAIAALDGDAVVGGLTAHTLPMTRAEVSELFIYDVAVRGDRQRQGIGRALMTAVREAAAAAGVGEAFVPAETEDAHALDFYRALGGVPTEVVMFSFDGPSPVSPAAPPADVRVAGAVAALGLAASALLHALWLVSPWPLAGWAEWSRAFGGASFRVPAPIMLGVALLFASSAHLVAGRAALVRARGPAWLYRWGTWATAGVLVARAVVGFVEMPRTLADPATPAAFRDTIRLYLRLYLPIFLALGVASGYVALRARRAGGGPFG